MKVRGGAAAPGRRVAGSLVGASLTQGRDARRPPAAELWHKVEKWRIAMAAER